MKLKNKLLPLVGVSAVCATVAPIALTSCAKSGFVNLKDGYTSQIGMHDAKTLTATAAADLYWTAVQESATANQDINVLNDDYYWSLANFNNGINTLVHSSSRENGVGDDSEKISNVSARKVKLADETEMWLVSYKREFTQDRAATYWQQDRIVKRNGYVEYKDVPLELRYDTSNACWYVTLNTDNLTGLLKETTTTTSIVAKYSYYYYEYDQINKFSEESTKNFDVTIDKNYTWKQFIKDYDNSWGQALIYFIAGGTGYYFGYNNALWYSHYLWKVAYNDEK